MTRHGLYGITAVAVAIGPISDLLAHGYSFPWRIPLAGLLLFAALCLGVAAAARGAPHADKVATIGAVLALAVFVGQLLLLELMMRTGTLGVFIGHGQGVRSELRVYVPTLADRLRGEVDRWYQLE